MSKPVTLLALSLLLPACSPSADKGDEDHASSDGKADSFGNPTQHGQLRFGTASNATLSDDEKFHAWQFELTGDADVNLTVDSSTSNLDTVMYLYRRDNESDNWGNYIARNDDNGESLLSALDRAGEKGFYKVLVKGYKTSHRGSFKLTGTCAGDGCPSNDGGNVEVPAATAFTDACASALRESMRSQLIAQSSFGVIPETTSGHDRAVLVATAHYSEFSDWREFADEGEDEFVFDVEYTQLESGAIVRMSDGGDESTIDYAFDGDHNLLAYYAHNQSPWTEYYCGANGEAAEQPEDDCLSDWMSNAPHGRDSETDGAETWEPAGPNDEISPAMDLAVAHYQANVLGDDASVAINIESTAWVDDWRTGTEMTLVADGFEMVFYTAVDDWLVFSSSENDDDRLKMICTR